MVPPAQMAKLRGLCQTSKIMFESFPEASHMNAYNECHAAYWSAVKDFIEEFQNN